MQRVEIIAHTENTFIESCLIQIHNHTYLVGDKIDEPIIRDFNSPDEARDYFSLFLVCASNYNSLDLKPIK